MEPNLLKYIWRYSRPQQITVVLLTLASFPILYLTLELPKWIINDALVADSDQKELFGHMLDAVPYLAVLCFSLLGLIIANGLLKMQINTRKGVIGERLVRRLRYSLVQNTLRFPLPYFSRISSGELISTVTAETEPLGGYIGESIALPLFQGGTMITILVFMFAQDWVFGLVSVALIPVQGYLIPKLQHQINLLKKERVRKVRKLSERIGETVAGATEIRLHGTQPYTLAEFSNRFGVLFGIRLEIFKKKFFMKFLNNTIGQITPFMFYLFGGYLVIKGDLTIGALVAAIGAYKDLTSPWRELLNFYQLQQDSKIKYQQIIELFYPDELVEVDEVETESDALHLRGDITLSNISFRNENGETVLSGINLHIDQGKMIAITGDFSIRRSRLAQIMAGLTEPTSGQLRIDGKLLSEIPDSILRRRLAFQGPDPHMFAGTIVENMEYGLNQFEPEVPENDSELLKQVKEAKQAGNRSPIQHGWLDYRQAGQSERERSPEWYQAVIKAMGADEVVFDRSLYEIFDPEDKPELTAKLMAARKEISQRLLHTEEREEIISFDPDSFNSNASIGENLLFGVAVDERLDNSNFSVHPYFIQTLKNENLFIESIEIGLNVAQSLISMADENTLSFSLREQFGLTEEERIEDARYTVENFNQPEKISVSCQQLLLSIFLRIIPERNRFITLDARQRTRLLQARREFGAQLPEDLQKAVVPFDATQYHSRLTVKDNLLFGRVASQNPLIERKLNGLMAEVIDEMDLRKDLILLLGESQVGISGSRLPLLARHRISLGRVLMKKPDILIFHDALGPLDPAALVERRREIRELLPDATIIWIAKEINDPAEFDDTYQFTEEGPLASLFTQSVEPTRKEEIEPSRRTSDPFELVSNSILFSGLTPGQKRFLADSSRLVTVPADTLIYDIDDDSDAAWLVVKGEVQTSSRENVVVGNFKRPEVFGSLDVLADCPRVMSARAITKTSLLRIESSAIETVAMSDANVSRVLLRSLSQQWRT